MPTFEGRPDYQGKISIPHHLPEKPKTWKVDSNHKIMATCLSREGTHIEVWLLHPPLRRGHMITVHWEVES